ncbi:MAG: mechanosensitive ion channel [Gammaproteobacteria bacterium]|nr:mechanosensitive ion channel [Gammaproteobacteria bacterium]
MAPCILWLVSGFYAHAATPAPSVSHPTAAATSDTGAAKPISVQDVLACATEDQQRVDQAKRLVAAPDPTNRLQRGLDDIARPVDAKVQNTTAGTLPELPVMRLESLARHWDFDSRRFDRWQAQARRALAPYADSAVQLAQRRAAWSATRAAGVLGELPPALSGRIDTLIAQIDETQKLLGAELERQNALMQRASDLQARIQTNGNEVAAAIDDQDRRLLHLDAPPLWQGLGSSAGYQAAVDAMERGMLVEQQYAVDYHAAGSGNQQALRVIQLALLPLVLWLVMRSRHARASAGETEREPDRVTRALRRPVSAWLLLSMLAVIGLEPDAPLLVQEAAMLIALVPVLRLLPSATLQALGIWPYIAVALYGLDRLGVALVADAALYRLFLLALNVLALVLTVGMLRRPRLDAHAHGRSLQRVTRSMAWVVLVLLAVALVSNVLGNVSLAGTLTSGVIDSGYMALLLYAGVAACLGIFRALLGQPEIASARFIRQHGPTLQAGFARLLMLGASFGWLVYTMDRLRLLRPSYEVGATVLAFGIDVGEVSIHLGDVLVFIVSAWLAFWVARAVQRLLRDELPNHGGLPRGVGNSIASLSYYGVLIVGLLVALSAAGFKVSQLTLVFGALGVGIGFGLQNVVNNFVSGLVLMVERPIQPGDVVETAGTTGSVRDIGLRATIIRSFDGADVVVPNGLLLSGNLTNWTMFDRSRRIELTVGVAYGSDPVRVLGVLNGAIQATAGVAAHPAPAALLNDCNDSALSFVVRVWTNDLSDLGNVRGELLARILASLDAAGISVPYKQMDVHLRTVPESMRAPLGSPPPDRMQGGDAPPIVARD